MLGVFVQLLFLFLSFPLLSAYFNGTVEEIEEFFDGELTDEILTHYGISAFGVTIVQGNETLFFKGYGYEDPFSDPMVDFSSQSVVNIGSVSKIFVGISSMMSLGPEELETDIDTLLPKNLQMKKELIGNYHSEMGKPIVPTNSKIRVMNLASHTSGFDEKNIIFNEYPKNLEKDIETNLPPRIRMPGVISSYNNYAIALLALLVELNNEESYTYEGYLQRKIFDVLEMGHTYYGYEDALTDDHFTKLSWKLPDGKIVDPETQQLFEFLNARPAGNVFSTHTDMAVLMTDLLHGARVLGMTEEQFNRLFTPVFEINHLPPINVVFYDCEYYGVKSIGHDGDIHPFHTYLRLFMEDEVGIFFTMNAINPLIRNDLGKKFVYRFMKQDDYCESIGGLEKNNSCPVKMDLLTEWPRRDQIGRYRKKYEKFVGCYMPSRHVHTGWAKFLSYWIYFWGAVTCLDITPEGYLHIMNTPIYFLENKFLGSEIEDDYIAATRIGDEVSFEFSEEHYFSLVYDSPDRKYIVTAPIFSTSEYIGDVKHYKWVFRLVDFFWNAPTYVLIMSICGLEAIMISFCVLRILLCVAARQKKKREQEKIPGLKDKLLVDGEKQEEVVEEKEDGDGEGKIMEEDEKLEEGEVKEDDGEEEKKEEEEDDKDKEQEEGKKVKDEKEEEEEKIEEEEEGEEKFVEVVVSEETKLEADEEEPEEKQRKKKEIKQPKTKLEKIVSALVKINSLLFTVSGASMLFATGFNYLHYFEAVQFPNAYMTITQGPPTSLLKLSTPLPIFAILFMILSICCFVALTAISITLIAYAVYRKRRNPEEKLIVSTTTVALTLPIYACFCVFLLLMIIYNGWYWRFAKFFNIMTSY